MPRKSVRIDISNPNNKNINPFDDFIRTLGYMRVNARFELMRAIGRIAAEILIQAKNLTRVDTGNLRNRWFIKRGSNFFDVINGARYASAREFGYIQKPRWVPGVFTAAGKFVYQKGAKTGIMLTRKIIPGDFMLKKGIDRTKDKIPKILDASLDDAARRAIKQTGSSIRR